jgi:hypothetical protein
MKIGKVIKNLHTLLLASCCIAFVFVFISYGITGSHMRLSGDDYCYDAVLKQSGFWDTQWQSYFQLQNYSGNRYTLTLFSSLIGLFGPKANAAVPGIVLAIWIAGTFWCIRLIAQQERQYSPLEITFITGMIIFFTLSLAPDLEQSLYWRPAMLPYLMPIVLNTILIGFILQERKSPPSAISRPFLSFLLALLAGGLSETGAALQAGYLTLWMTTSLLRRNGKAHWSHQLNISIGCAWLGTGIAIALLILSPTNTLRQFLLGLPEPPNLPTLLRLSIQYAYTFLHSTIKDSFLSHLLIFMSLLVLTSIMPPNQRYSGRESIPNPFLRLALLSFTAFILIMCVIAPSVWAQSDYPVARAMILARWITVLTSAVAGWIVGGIVRQRLQPLGRWQGYWILASALLVIAIIAFPCMEAKGALADLRRYQHWSNAWDARDQQIREARSQGIFEINVMELDHIIPDVAELRPDPDYWYNNCAESYYDVHSIIADQPGWDD